MGESKYAFYRTDLAFDDGKPAHGWYWHAAPDKHPVGPYDTRNAAENDRRNWPANIRSNNPNKARVGPRYKK